MGCIHYQANCEVRGSCCENFYACFRCHDLDHRLRETRGEPHHQFDRSGLDKVKCVACAHIQDPSNLCVNCGTTFGTYSCVKCSLYTNSTDKFTHCDQCGICLKGLASDLTHCTECNCCYPKSNSHNHFEGDQGKFLTHQTTCDICSKNLMRSPSQIRQCAHCDNIMHLNCVILSIKYEGTKCRKCQNLFLDDKTLDSVLNHPAMMIVLKDLPDQLNLADPDHLLKIVRFTEEII
jgi:RING finger/CHY zinc finger protein 1